MAIQITLLHNPGAGYEQYTPEQLVQSLQKAGYDVTYVPLQGNDYSKNLQKPGQMVVVAGGDGTVGRIAKDLVGRGIPIGLLPLGTASNIATTLGITGDPAQIIASWDLNRRKPFDVGVIRGAGSETFFLESFGFGLFPRLIRQREDDKSKKETTTREEELADALEHQKQILSEYPSHLCSIYLDEKQYSGNYLLVEVMNIQLAGPRMPLAPKADPGDGLLDVVLVREDEREKFARFLSSTQNEARSSESLFFHRARRVRIEWESIHYHVDDQAHEEGGAIKVDIHLMPQGLEFLVS